MKNTASLIIAVLVFAGCGDSKKSSSSNNNDVSKNGSGTTPIDDGRRLFSDAPIQSLTDVPGLTEQEATIRPELAALFCQHVYKLPHKADFAQELDILCGPDQTPSQVMTDLDRYGKVVGAKPKAVQLALNHTAEFTEAVYAAVYDLPIPPKWVRSGHIQDYMMKPSRFSNVTLDGKVAQDMNEGIGGDLQFSKYGLNYKTDVKTPDSKPFYNERNTEFNAFQVHGGNPDIGIGTEHLTGGANPDFPYFHTITVTIGNKTGGSVLITIIKGSVRHNSYTDLAAKVFSDTTSAQASNVHDGLMAELAGYIVK